MMNVLYVGKLFPRELVKTVADDSRGKMGMSNHNFEMSILNGFTRQENARVKCVIAPGVFSFPHNNRRLFTHAEHYEHNGVDVRSVGFCNLVVINRIWLVVSLVCALVRCIKSFPRGECVNIVLNTPAYFYLLAIKIARALSGRKTTLTVVIPDIPSMVTAMDRQNRMKHLFVGYMDRASMRMTSQADGLVLLTEAMMDFVGSPLPHIVMEGIVDVETMSAGKRVPLSDNRAILYTGTLRRIFGVMNLVEAFCRIGDDDAELWICGSGDSEAAIKEAVSRDSRIKFYGLVDSHKALELQRRASILVNPRTSEGRYTRYSFPSKTMEYLLAGRSTVINRLPGIPDEYYDYVYTPRDESVEALANTLSSVMQTSVQEREARAEAGRSFIMEQKNSRVQVQRILSLIKSYK
ncbi:MAG: glycosyltransferase [Muribaculaceae bacterium]|nr:glycosyltransferase [Muribaculaceae bacterium]